MNSINTQLDAIDRRILQELQADAAQANQTLAQRVHVSAATALRRTKRLRESGVIERQMAVLNPQKMGPAFAHGLTAVVEVTLDRQGSEHLSAFEARAVASAAVQQCYQVASGPDFVLIVYAAHMQAYEVLVAQLFTADANVRNVRAFFSVRRGKFEPAIALD